MSIGKLVKDLRLEFMQVYKNYQEAHDDLLVWASVQNDQWDMEAMGKIVQRIQDTYAQLYPALDHVRTDHDMYLNILKDYDLWVEKMVQSNEEAKVKVAEAKGKKGKKKIEAQA